RAQLSALRQQRCITRVGRDQGVLQSFSVRERNRPKSDKDQGREGCSDVHASPKPETPTQRARFGPAIPGATISADAEISRDLQDFLNAKKCWKSAPFSRLRVVLMALDRPRPAAAGPRPRFVQ